MKLNLALLLLVGFVAFAVAVPVEQPDREEDPEPKALEDDLEKEDGPAGESEEILNDQESLADDEGDDVENDQESDDNDISKRGVHCKWVNRYVWTQCRTFHRRRCCSKKVWVRHRVCRAYNGHGCYTTCEYRRICRGPYRRCRRTCYHHRCSKKCRRHCKMVKICYRKCRG